MIKLYRTKFTPLELRTLSEYCQNFCPYGLDKSECFNKSCALYSVCTDLQRLARYAEALADEISRPKKPKLRICTLLKFSHSVTISQISKFPIDTSPNL